MSFLPLAREFEGFQRPAIAPVNGEEYEYVIQIGPGPLAIKDHMTWLDKIASTILEAMNRPFRRAIGLRLWTAFARIGVNSAQVTSIYGGVIVEGKTEWLGGQWQLARSTPQQEAQLLARQGIPWQDTQHYFMKLDPLTSGFSRAQGTGISVYSWFTPSATSNEKQSASRFYMGCLTSRQGCRTVCDLVPGASEYVRIRPNASELCSKPAQGYQ